MSFHSRRSSSFLLLTVLNVNLFLWTKTQNQHLFLLLGHVELDYTFFVFSTTYFFSKPFLNFASKQTGGSVCSSALSILALAL